MFTVLLWRSTHEVARGTLEMVKSAQETAVSAQEAAERHRVWKFYEAQKDSGKIELLKRGRKTFYEAGVLVPVFLLFKLGCVVYEHRRNSLGDRNA